MEAELKILGIPGSTRSGSYNRSLLMEALEALPPDVQREVFDIRDIPLFDPDSLNDQPEAVRALRLAIEEADAVVIATPEYNHSVPGVLKNAIDWISRPREGNPFEWKPVAIMSASTGMLGGIRAQEHLRQILTSLGAIIVPKPEVAVAFADRKFKDGKLDDTVALSFIRELMENLLSLARALRARREACCAQNVYAPG